MCDPGCCHLSLCCSLDQGSGPGVLGGRSVDRLEGKSSISWPAPPARASPGAFSIFVLEKRPSARKQVHAVDPWAAVPRPRNTTPNQSVTGVCIHLPGLGNKGPQAEWFQQPKFPLFWAWRRKSGPASWAPSEAENNLSQPLPQLVGVCWQVSGSPGLFRHCPHLCLYLHTIHLPPVCLCPLFVRTAVISG